MIGQLATAKLEASRTMERRLGTVRLELVKPERLFWLAAAAGCLIAVGISFFLRARVSRPIEKLSHAVAALARGEPKPVRSRRTTSSAGSARRSTAWPKPSPSEAAA